MEYQGFQSALSLYVAIPITIFLIILAFVSYKKNNALPPSIKFTLSTLRSIAFIVIIFLILNPIFLSNIEEKQKPKILFLLDNSESVAVKKGKYSGLEDYARILNFLIDSKPTHVEIDYFTIGNRTKPLDNIDSLTYSESSTNLIDAINQIKELEEDYSTAVIISDGILTFGRNPLIASTNISIPINTIGIGDTSKVRDLSVHNIITNAIGYTNTKQLVDVEIAHNGFEGKTISIQISDKFGEVISENKRILDNNTGIITEQFIIELSNEGLTPFIVSVKDFDEEWSTKNNAQSFVIDVQDSKTRILHISAEVHPDVKFLRSLLTTDVSIELQTLTWLGENNFVEKKLPETEELDLIILHGNPDDFSSLDVFNSFSDKPTLLLELPNSRTLNNNNNYFELISKQSYQLFETNIYPSNTIESHPILELDEINYESLAPIVSTINTELKEDSSIPLFFVGFQGIQTEQPIFAITEQTTIRRAHISSWGWYKLYQSPNKNEREFVSQLFTNLISWVSNNPDHRLLKITPAKNSFNSSEQVLINASLINESGNPEADATIELVISSETLNEKIINLNNLGAGNYSVTLDDVVTGLISFKATARKNSRIIDEQIGEFIIEKLNTELTNILRDDFLLSSIANETEGSFFTSSTVNNFWDTISDSNLLENKTEIVTSYYSPVRSMLWFVLLILLLGTEWLVRRFYSIS